MKKLIVASALALTTLAGLATGPKVQASSTTKSAKVSFKQYKINKKYKNGVKAKFSFNLPQLKGKSAAIKKINKDLKKIYSSEKSSFTRATRGYSQLAGAIKKDTYYDLTKTSVSYNKNGIISFKVDKNWWTGYQINNKKIPYHVIGGWTYSLKNGKGLSITDIVKGSKSSVRKQLIAGATKKFKIKKGEAVYVDMVDMISGNVNLYYYLKGGKVYLYPIIIEPLNYDFTHHNPPIYYNSHFTIPSRYK
ncbi:hypothetical protein [Lactobacillus porci]|uniref:DUF4163 domain-containing protein n=1 Tax=Lactobacillus porci TaxID=2012477 RepID=A0A6A8MGJ8_9LACO|nr:hypothetical protein [Lactobacillus porci]MST87964.1 DUF4163 domain-containing protein [Lactobacillus porci]